MISEIYRRAAEGLYERGWTKHSMFAIDGSVCALGSVVSELTKALPQYGAGSDLFPEGLLFCVCGLSVQEGREIAIFNDSPDTTMEDAVMLLLFMAEDRDWVEAEREAMVSIKKQLADLGPIDPKIAWGHQTTPPVLVPA